MSNDLKLPFQSFDDFMAWEKTLLKDNKTYGINEGEIMSFKDMEDPMSVSNMKTIKDVNNIVLTMDSQESVIHPPIKTGTGFFELRKQYVQAISSKANFDILRNRVRYINSMFKKPIIFLSGVKLMWKPQIGSKVYISNANTKTLNGPFIVDKINPKTIGVLDGDRKMNVVPSRLVYAGESSKVVFEPPNFWSSKQQLPLTFRVDPKNKQDIHISAAETAASYYETPTYIASIENTFVTEFFEPQAYKDDQIYLFFIANIHLMAQIDLWKLLLSISDENKFKEIIDTDINKGLFNIYIHDSDSLSLAEDVYNEVGGRTGIISYEYSNIPSST